MSAARDLVEGAELWVGLGAGASAAVAAHAGRDRVGRDLVGLAVAAGVVVASLATGRKLPLAVIALAAVAAVWPLPGRDRAGAAPVARVVGATLALAAAVGAYACLPDTERPTIVVGVVAGVAAVVVAVGGPWVSLAAGAGGAVMGLALDDVRREAAVLGTAAVAAALVIGVLSLRRAGASAPKAVLLGVAGVVVMGVCSRVVGVADGATAAGGVGVLALGAWAALAWAAAR